MTPDKDPEFVIGDFRADMDYFALTNSKTSYIFSVAYDTVTYYYDMYIEGDGDCWDGACMTD